MTFRGSDRCGGLSNLIQILFRVIGIGMTSQKAVSVLSICMVMVATATMIR
jgi:hypothetical protein